MKIFSINDIDYKSLLQVENIFFETSSKKEFSSICEKDKFKQKYLNYYIENYSEYFYVAIKNDSVIGYICCCPNTLKDSYFLDTFKYYELIDASQLESYPAHLHINLSQTSRGLGLGSVLVDKICNKLKVSKIRGIHIFTIPSSPNVSFYTKNLFCDELTVEYHDTSLLFMGRNLSISNL